MQPHLTPSDRARFYSKRDTSGECWPWTAGHFTNGYGQFNVGNRPYKANRIAWMLEYGDIPAGLWVLHNCPGGDNKLCVRPSHLWLGTHEDNMRDMVTKGRAASGERNWQIAHPEMRLRGERHWTHRKPEAVKRGEAHPNTRVADTIKIEIRARYAQGNIGQRELARQYDLSKTHIGRIIRGESRHG